MRNSTGVQWLLGDHLGSISVTVGELGRLFERRSGALDFFWSVGAPPAYNPIKRSRVFHPCG
jgi:hypothetical protein